MTMTTRLTALVLLLGVSVVLSQELYYEPLVVPRLAEWKEVPVLWWVAAFAPEFAASVAAALLSRSTKEWLLFCLLGGLLVTTLKWGAGVFNQPGHIKAIEGGIVHFALQFLSLTVLLFGAVGAVRLIRLGFQSRALTGREDR